MSRISIRTNGSAVYFYLYRDEKREQYAAMYWDEVQVTAAMATFIDRFDVGMYPKLNKLNDLK